MLVSNRAGGAVISAAMLRTAEKAAPTLKDLQDELSRNSTFLFYKGDFSTYNIKTDTWEDSPIKFIKRAYHNTHLYDNSVYVLGGKRTPLNKKREYLDNEIEVFNLNENFHKIEHIFSNVQSLFNARNKNHKTIRER